jgi:hypothetical protein
MDPPSMSWVRRLRFPALPELRHPATGRASTRGRRRRAPRRPAARSAASSPSAASMQGASAGRVPAGCRKPPSLAVTPPRAQRRSPPRARPLRASRSERRSRVVGAESLATNALRPCGTRRVCARSRWAETPVPTRGHRAAPQGRAAARAREQAAHREHHRASSRAAHAQRTERRAAAPAPSRA